MDVDPAPHSIASHMEEEEKKPNELMDQEVIAPPVVPQVSEHEVIVPPYDQKKEKTLVSKR